MKRGGAQGYMDGLESDGFNPRGERGCAPFWLQGRAKSQNTREKHRYDRAGTRVSNIWGVEGIRASLQKKRSMPEDEWKTAARSRANQISGSRSGGFPVIGQLPRFRPIPQSGGGGTVADKGQRGESWKCMFPVAGCWFSILGEITDPG